MPDPVDETIRELETEAKRGAKAGPGLCVIWKSGGRQIVQSIADAVKTSHPILYRLLSTAIKIIDSICP